MKKITAIILTLAMLFAFAACGSTPDEDEVRGEQVVNTTEAPSPSEDVTDAPDTNVTAAPDTDVTDAPEIDVTDAPEIDVTDAPETDVIEPEFSLGAVEGINYENKFIGIGCNLPSDWAFYTDEQIREINNLTADLAGEDFEEAMKNASLVYDMYAASKDNLKNINVNLEKVDPIALATIDLADIFEQNEAFIKQSLENMGCSNITFEHGTVNIDGETFNCLRSTYELNGIPMYQIAVAKKCNGYIATFAITSFYENSIDSILDCFYVIK